MIRGTAGPRLLAAILLAECVFIAAPFAHAANPVRLIPVGRYDFEAPPEKNRALLPEGLSGIAWIGGDQYIAIGDEHACLHALTIKIDPGSGRILSAKLGAATPLQDSLGVPIPDSTMGKDREGIALDPSGRSVWLANEWTGSDVHRPSLSCHLIATGRMTALVGCDSDPMLRVFANIRYNLGFESLTRRPGGGEVWTANEGPLTVDGPRATDSTGAVVRLQEFDDAMHPVAQYAYEIDPYRARITSPFFLARNEVIGLSELLALPDGRLLALERAFAGDSAGAANFRQRIYLVETDGATDVSRGDLASGLVGRTYAPARKTFLWELNSGFTNSNFEGMTLGPPLANGDQSVILVADNDTGRKEALFALRLVFSR